MARKSKRSLARMARLDRLVGRMYAYYQSGHTLQETGAKFGAREVSGVYALFKIRGLKRRKEHLPQSYARAGLKRRGPLDAIAHAMHADYERPMSLYQVAKKWGHDHGVVRRVFVRNGLAVRPFKQLARQANGSPVLFEKTPKQIAALIAKMTRIMIPDELRVEWRHWSLARRGKFVAQVRAKLKLDNGRPTTPFSAGIEPFDYGTPPAHAIADRMNAGLPSRSAVTMIRLCSQGVIYRGKLYFWSKSSGPAYFIGPWRPGPGRPPLHHIIWEEHNGPVPAGHAVRHADGNRNNFDPANLVLASRNDVCRENQSKALTAKSRAITALLLARQQKGKPHAHTNTLTALRVR